MNSTLARKIITNIEVTDTYGGEANYSWVKRYSIEIPASLSNLAIVRRAKKEAGWTGAQCKVENFGDMIALRPYGACQVMFITFHETE